MHSDKEPQVTPEAFTIPEFGTTYKTSRTATYEEMSSGRLESYKVGRRHYISRRAAEKWQREREEQSQATKAA
jgi:hypothetical protein